MAAKVGVLAVNQLSTDQPTSFLKRSAAEALLRRLIAERIGKFVIRLLPLRDFHPLPAQRQSKAYIPSKMPWAELPGVKFVDPISKTATQNQAVKRRFFVMAANRMTQL